MKRPFFISILNTTDFIWRQVITLLEEFYSPLQNLKGRRVKMP